MMTKQRIFIGNRTFRFAVVLFLPIAVVFSFMNSNVNAAQTIPYKVNFQGRLTDNIGNIKPDGLYNMKLRLFGATSGGTALWTEVRGETVNRVQVTNGLFSIQLGDVSTLSPSLFTTQPLYLEVELPSPATATCSTSGCASYTEGAMSPRSPLGSSPYAFNADTVDGIDGSQLARTDVSNTFTSSTYFNDQLSLQSGKPLSFNAAYVGSNYQIQQTGSASYLNQTTNGLEIGGSISQNSGTTATDLATVLTVKNNGNGISSATDGGVINPNNLLSNPSFEFGNAGWQSATVATNGSARTGTTNIETVQGSNTSQFFAYSRPIAIQPGEQYYLSGYVKTSSTTTGTGGYQFLFTDSSGAAVGSTDTDYTNPGTSYALRSGSTVVPSGAVYMVIRPIVQGTGSTAGTWDFDDVSAQRIDQAAPATFRNNINSTGAFKIQDASGAPLLVADTTNLDLKVGGGDVSPDGNPALFVLDYKNTSGDPAGSVNGAMYYNAVSNKFRCNENSTWKDCISSASSTVSARSTFDYKNDFFLNAADNILVQNVSGGTVVNQTGELNHPGLVRLATGTAVNNRTGYISSATSTVFGGGVLWSANVGIRLNNLSTTSETNTIRVGFIDTGSADSTNGCYLRYTNGTNSGKWQGVCRKASTESVCDTGITVAAGTWYNLQIAVDGTPGTVSFNNGTTTACTITTNIPTSTTSPGISMLKTVGTTNTQTVDLDYLQYHADNINR